MADIDELAGADDILLEDELGESVSAPTSSDANGSNGTVNADDSTLTANSDHDQSIDDPELLAIKARVREMEEESKKLREMQCEVDKQMFRRSPVYEPTTASPLNVSLEEKVETDARSVFVGNVDYGATAEELEQHFHGCGSVNRVTIQCGRFDGSPKGFAYIEFTDKDSVETAMALDESLFRGRQIKVLPKRTNRPGMSSTQRPPRGRGYRGAGRSYRGGFRSRRPRYRRNYYAPY